MLRNILPAERSDLAPSYARATKGNSFLLESHTWAAGRFPRPVQGAGYYLPSFIQTGARTPEGTSFSAMNLPSHQDHLGRVFSQCPTSWHQASSNQTEGRLRLQNSLPKGVLHSYHAFLWGVRRWNRTNVSLISPPSPSATVRFIISHPVCWLFIRSLIFVVFTGCFTELMLLYATLSRGIKVLRKADIHLIHKTNLSFLAGAIYFQCLGVWLQIRNHWLNLASPMCS